MTQPEVSLTFRIHDISIIRSCLDQLVSSEYPHVQENAQRAIDALEGAWENYLNEILNGNSK